MADQTPEAKEKAPRPKRSRVPFVIVGATCGVLLAGALLFSRAHGATNQLALASKPRGVTVVAARATTYRPTRRYVGTVEPWVSARIGPQLVSAYVDTVLVRPGAAVKKGDVIATLDCRNASATEKAVSMQARALETTQAAIAREASRMSGLLDGGYASANEVEMKQAESASKQAQLLALQAQMMGSSLQVSDCILRAPFDGEIADRLADPGAFARPGSAIATLIDRRTLRVAADVPERDFAAVAPGTEVRLHTLATGQDRVAPIARRAPSADDVTRTVHVEIDLANADRSIPVGTTAELFIDVGEPRPACEIPLAAAAVKGKKAQLFVIEGDAAHARAVAVEGEAAGCLYVDPTALKPGSLIVTEGRTALSEGDRVLARREEPMANATATGLEAATATSERTTR